MARRASVDPDFAKVIAKTEESRRVVQEAAVAAGSYASVVAQSAGAPWMRRQSDTIEVQVDSDGVYLVNTDYAGHLMEWGSKNNPPHAPLRRGVRALGLRFHEE